jgi:hypothetical protein
MSLTALVLLSTFSAADSLPETVTITGPDTAIGSSWPAVNLYYCASGLLPNSVSQWDITNYSGFGPYPPYNNPGSCQYFNIHKNPSWIPSHHVVSCTNYGSTGYFNTYIIPWNGNQTFGSVVRLDDSCSTRRVTTTLNSNLYRAQPVIIFPHRWQYQHPGSGVWTDFLDNPGNLSGVDVNIFYANPISERYNWTVDSLFGHPVYDTTFYEGGSVRLNLNNPPAALNGLWIRKVLDRYAGSSVTSTPVQIWSVRQPVNLVAAGSDTLTEGSSGLYYVSNPQLFNQFQWTVLGGTALNSPTNDSIWVRWDSVGTGTVTAHAWSTTSCVNRASTNVEVRGLSLGERQLPSIAISPNPSSGWIEVKLETEGVPYQVTDATGRCVARGLLNSGRQNHQLRQGVYTLTAQGYAPVRIVVATGD